MCPSFFYIWINEFRFLQLFRIFDRCSCIFDRRVPICSLKRTRANGYNKVRSVFAWINNESRRKFSLWTLADIFMVVKKSVWLLIFGNIFAISICHLFQSTIWYIKSRQEFHFHASVIISCLKMCFGRTFESNLWKQKMERKLERSKHFVLFKCTAFVQGSPDLQDERNNLKHVGGLWRSFKRLRIKENRQDIKIM